MRRSGYRLPKRYGLVSFDVRNLFDQEFDYQNSFNAGAQQLPPLPTFAGRLLAYQPVVVLKQGKWVVFHRMAVTFVT